MNRKRGIKSSLLDGTFEADVEAVETSGRKQRSGGHARQKSMPKNLKNAPFVFTLVLMGCGGVSPHEAKKPKEHCATLISMQGDEPFSLQMETSTVHHYSPEFEKCFGLSTGMDSSSGMLSVSLTTWGARIEDLNMVALCDIDSDTCLVDTSIGSTSVSTGREVSRSDFAAYVIQRMDNDTPEAFVNFVAVGKAGPASDEFLAALQLSNELASCAGAFSMFEGIARKLDKGALSNEELKEGATSADTLVSAALETAAIYAKRAGQPVEMIADIGTRHADGSPVWHLLTPMHGRAPGCCDGPVSVTSSVPARSRWG